MSERRFSKKYKAIIYDEWCRFHDTGTADAHIVPDYIYASWKRCRAMGINPYLPERKMLAAEELYQRKQRHASFIEIVRGVMATFFPVVAASSSTMVLADAEGAILHFMCNESASTSLIAAPTGSLSREEFIGTAGTATCIVEQKPIELFGAEHYCTFYHECACHSSPIFDSRSKLVGVMTIISPWDEFHPHTVGMISTAVRAIREQLHLKELLDATRALMDVLDEGVIVLDADNAISNINQKALSMLGLGGECLHKPLSNVIKCPQAVAAKIVSRTACYDEVTTLTALGCQSCPCVLSAVPVTASGAMVLTLREAERMRAFATRITGAKAAYVFEDILGESRQLAKVMSAARKIACNDSTVLILGESGTGKELFAQAIHNESARRQGPFIVVNCGALPRDLIQSELFGYAEGAFTGASRHGKLGKFELAEGGTIFLDEIGEMPLDAQVSLLRFLQNGEVSRVGDKSTRRINVRVIAATNRDLEYEVRNKTFRNDLYYRLNVFPIHVPPLRERKEDIAVLARYFIQKNMKLFDKQFADIPGVLLEALSSYAWPGNVRELENTLERMVYMAQHAEGLYDELPARIRAASECVNEPLLPGHLVDEDSALQRIQQVLSACGGNKQAAAKALGISRSTLYYKLRQTREDTHTLPVVHRVQDDARLLSELRQLDARQKSALIDLLQRV